MIAIDTNVLIAAHRRDAPSHPTCLELLRRLHASGQPFVLFWPCLYEFLRVVTHHRVFQPPSSTAEAMSAVRDLLALPGARILGETERHPEILETVIAESGASGNLCHDAHIVALALEHGVERIVTYDKDFARFAGVRAEPPEPPPP